MSTYQWANASLLNNPDLGFDTYFAVSSMQDIQMNFLSPPEIALFGCPANISNLLGLAIFDSDLEGQYAAQTFMSPENYYDFSRFFDTNDFAAISARWGIDQTVAQCVYMYVSQQAGYNSYQSSANMVAASLTTTIDPIEKNLPIGLTARLIAYYNNLDPATWTCQYVFEASMSDSRAAEICNATDYNFGDPATV